MGNGKNSKPYLFGIPIAKEDSYKTVAEWAFENKLEIPIKDRSHVEHLKSFYKGLISPVLGLPYKEKTQKEETMKHEEIKIKITNNGYYVQVGCQSFVFTNDTDLSIAIVEYKNDPEAAQKKYCGE